MADEEKKKKYELREKTQEDRKKYIENNKESSEDEVNYESKLGEISDEDNINKYEENLTEGKEEFEDESEEEIAEENKEENSEKGEEIMEKDEDKERKNEIETLKEELEKTRKEIQKLNKRNLENLAKKDEVLQKYSDENTKLKNQIKVISKQLKETEAERNGLQMIAQENEEKQKMKKKQEKKENNHYEKEIKALKDTLSQLKDKHEELEENLSEEKTITCSLNNYIKTLENVNKDIINKIAEEDNQKPRKDTEKVANKEYQINEEIHQGNKKSTKKVYIGNLSEGITEEILKKNLNIDDHTTKIDIKKETVNQSNENCKEGRNCAYGKSCKFGHPAEGNRGYYAIITTNEHTSEMILKKDKISIKGTEIIVEKMRIPKVCKFALKGNCKFEGKCDYIHLKQKRNVKQCRYYEKGLCKKGKECKFSHNRSTQQEEQNFQKGTWTQRISKMEENISELKQMIEQQQTNMKKAVYQVPTMREYQHYQDKTYV